MFLSLIHFSQEFAILELKMVIGCTQSSSYNPVHEKGLFIPPKKKRLFFFFEHRKENYMTASSLQLKRRTSDKHTLKKMEPSVRISCLPEASKTLLFSSTEFLRTQTRDSHIFLPSESPTKTTRFPLTNSSICLPFNLQESPSKINQTKMEAKIK